MMSVYVSVLPSPTMPTPGWLDNAGSFDKLIPLLSSGELSCDPPPTSPQNELTADLYVVAIDLPGHGQSSHRPWGKIPNYEDYIVNIKYVIDGTNP